MFRADKRQRSSGPDTDLTNARNLSVSTAARTALEPLGAFAKLDKSELAGPAVPEPGYDSHTYPTADWGFGIDVNGVVRHYAAMRSKA